MNELFSKPEQKFDASNNKKYEVEAIINSTIYAQKAKGHLLGLYYLVSYKGYPKKEHTWEPSSAVMHLSKMISTFYKDHSEKATATFPPFDSTPPMAKPSVKPAKPSAKRKQGRPTGSTKQAKEWDIRQWGFFSPVLVRLGGFFTNFVGFKKDAYSASFSNSVSFYLWAAHRYYTLYLWVTHCHWSFGFPL